MKIIEDTFGTTILKENSVWGKNTQRSLENFPIGEEKMPRDLIAALVSIKRAAATVNRNHGKLDPDKAHRIVEACDLILTQDLRTDFPLSLWQTGSGTQTNMNVNEVIAHYSNTHPNDDVNCGQSSNDVFPTAMHIMAYKQIEHDLLPSMERFRDTLKRLSDENMINLKTGRTHLQDATPMSFGQEVSAWQEMLVVGIKQIKETLVYLKEIPIGATAVGTGLNTFEGFDKELSDHLGMNVCENKFYGISTKDSFVHAHGVLNTIATNLMKIVNDIRWLSSGPRCGLGEISIPANEAGSSIMPGKINPTQCESLMMICAQVMGNNHVVTISNMQGNFQLNTFMPVIAHNFWQSVKLLSEGMDSFNKRCLSGIKVINEKIEDNLTKSLMSATYLNSKLGYDETAKLVNKAFVANKNIKDVVIESGNMNEEEFDEFFKYSDMITPD